MFDDPTGGPGGGGGLPVCKPHHDWFAATLTFGLICGLIVSYLPQHHRIISTKSSEGFSPWYLLLGSTSAATAMWNVISMQWGIIRCCREINIGSCVEMTAGILLVSIQWFMFTMVFVLYIIYYPPHLKYFAATPAIEETTPLLANDSPAGQQKERVEKRTDEWSLSLILAWVFVMNLVIILITTLFLVLTEPLNPHPEDGPASQRIQAWATFLGLVSATLSAVQYTPQIWRTYRNQLVGALSIPMMCIQTPGAVLMVSSIALSPGTNWTSWLPFAVAGIMQGALLSLCILWKFRQDKLGIDDFGNPVVTDAAAAAAASGEVAVVTAVVRED